MSRSFTFFPHPLLSALLVVLWLLLNNSIEPGQLILGGFFGIVVPLFTRRFWPQRLGVGRPLLVIKLAGRVVKDIVSANFSVALVVLGPTEAVKPGFVKVPLDVDSDFVTTLLATLVSLTPGTVSADIDMEKRVLLVHTLNSDDPEALIQEIKTRYEAPIKEIFLC
ncbi:MAG: Na+/H+ antiporter subunit E [Gammaproteobacteria bacterium]|nr:Na+/H+ antiporter subunit E [Gammaproteobacteria bacterium]